MKETISFGKYFRRIAIDCCVFLLAFVSSCTAGAAEPASMDLRLGGGGGVYFYAPKGPLWVEVYKQDLNTRNIQTHLRALLFGPDRTVIEEVWIGDDGQAAGKGRGPVQRRVLRADVERPGVYGLNVTVTNDRYGEHVSWGFRTNCPKYLIETSRGHKDERHTEPIVLRNADAPGNVSFMPRTGAFSIEVSGLAKGLKELPIFDESGRKIHTVTVSAQGTARREFAADRSRLGSLWRLHLPQAQATIHVDGLTRWESGEAWENQSLWTPDVSSWFKFRENRWLLAPYRRNVYAEAGAEGVVEFRVHNNSAESKRVRLALEFDKGAVWDAALSQTRVELAGGRWTPVVLRYKAPSQGMHTCYVRATVEDEAAFSTWSSLTLNIGAAPAESRLALPLKLEPYRHENEQFGYLPDYPLDNQLYFDMGNRPFVVAQDGILALRDGKWVKTTRAYRGDNGKVIQIRPLGTKIAFDTDNDVYFLGRDGSTTLLFHSRNHGEDFVAWPVPGSGSFDMEQFSGHNVISTPPPLVRFYQTARDTELKWRRINDLDLILPSKGRNGSIVMGDPIVVSRKCIGLSAHSGIPSSVISRGEKVHVTWGEATLPEENVSGVPTYVATYDRSTGTLGSAALVGYGPPANDVHNSPCITIDKDGFLHVLIGTHGRTFKYIRSLASNSAGGGWTEAEDVGAGLRQTYVGMVCDDNDTLHLVFRLWLTDDKYFPASHYANLAYMRKRSSEKWSDVQPLVVAPFSEYSIFYHRLTIDRNHTLFLSYDYWSTFWFYRTDHRGSRRALMTSLDRGETWQLVPSTKWFK